MATTRNLLQLFRAIALDDMGTATTIASQICENEEQKGHKSAARSLRGALLKNGVNGNHSTNFEPNSDRNRNGFLNTALVNLSSNVPLSDVVLVPEARTELDAVIHEWSRRDHLQRRGLKPRSKLLFYGPPGCGKSLAARALSHELDLPIYLVRFNSVIGAYLGQTAIHLRQIFHFTETRPCILLLDELDALGKQRGNSLDVGELDRIVIALLQELEHSNPIGLIIATSNLAQNLDEALWRRFDLTLEFKSPTKSSLVGFCRKVAEKFEVRLPEQVLTRAKNVQSFAAAESLVIAEARRQALEEK